MRSIDLIAAHGAGDFVFQDDEMARLKLTDPAVRARHVTRYTLTMVPAALATRANVGRVVAFLALVWITHYITDSRRWLPNDEWAPGTIINDQVIHLATLAVLGRLLD